MVERSKWPQVGDTYRTVSRNLKVLKVAAVGGRFYVQCLVERMYKEGKEWYNASEWRRLLKASSLMKNGEWI